jgi:hypothetical protein
VYNTLDNNAYLHRAVSSFVLLMTYRHEPRRKRLYDIAEFSCFRLNVVVFGTVT